MLVGLPGRWDEACFAVPAVRALVKSGLAGGVVWAGGEAGVWGGARAPAAPATLVKRRVTFSDGSTEHVEASRDEWFLRGTEPNSTLPMQVAARQASGAGARIVMPTDGTIIALDPDIPIKNQRVALKSGDLAQANCWEVNGESLGCAEGNGFWSPTAGNFTIRLLDAKGEERDRVMVTVRGSLKVAEAR